MLGLSQRVSLEISSQLSGRPISNESTKETRKPLAGSRDPSEDQGNHPSEAQTASISSTQLLYVVSDLDRLQEWVSFTTLADAWVCKLWDHGHPARTSALLVLSTVSL